MGYGQKIPPKNENSYVILKCLSRKKIPGSITKTILYRRSSRVHKKHIKNIYKEWKNTPLKMCSWVNPRSLTNFNKNYKDIKIQG